MRIKDMFERDIDRNIEGVVKVGQEDDATIEQELSEYVVTDELRRHFATFYDAYDRALDVPTDKIGVWISGFFGSGKSHFLKMLSYLLSNQQAAGKTAIDYIEPKFDDPMVAAKARRAAGVPTQTILFNVDSKGPVNKDSMAILRIFARVFYEMQGFYGEDLKLARLERRIDQLGKTEEFRRAYERETGSSWIETRADYDFNDEEVARALEESGVMGRESALRWIAGSEEAEISIDRLTDEIRDYAEAKAQEHGGKYRLVFMADEIGQYIGSDTNLMLNLQTIVENLGTKCAGRVWVMVTSQEAIDEVTTVVGNDFSKIQGRFDTRLSLSSSDADEVIKRRILSKDKTAEDLLEMVYSENETVLTNLFSFRDAVADLKGYADGPDFAATFPFANYQFTLMQNVMTGLRKQGSSGKHLSSGERSMLEGFQRAAQAVEGLDENALVPFWMFYDTLQDFLESYHRRVINRAAEAAANGEGLESYDVAVLKLLFLIRWVDREIPANIDNVVTLMTDDVRVNRMELRERVQGSLDRLLAQNYITRNGDTYQFLTDEEQEIARQIARTEVTAAKLTKKAADIMFGSIFDAPKIAVGKNQFPIEEYIDETRVNSPGGLKLRVIAGMDGQSSPAPEDLVMRSMQNEAIVLLSPEISYYDSLLEAARIEAYSATVNRMNMPKSQQDILASKMREKTALEQRAAELMQEAVRRGQFFAAGSPITPPASASAKKLIESCASRLVESVYGKIGYVDRNFDSDADVRQILTGGAQPILGAEGIRPNARAIEELRRMIASQQRLHIDVKMGDIQRKFQDAPYGWRELDIAAVTAELIAQGDVRLMYAGSPVDPGKPDCVDCLRRASKVDKVTVEMRIRLSEGELMAARRVTEEFSGERDLPTDEDALASAVRKLMERRRTELKELLATEYKRNRQYPGSDIVTEAIAALDGVLSAPNDPADFLRAVANAREDLEESAEDLGEVDNFFRSQRDIFDAADAWAKRLKGERDYLASEPEAIEALDSIEDVLRMAHPYRRIAELATHIQTISAAYGKLLAEKREDVLAQIEEIYSGIEERARELDVTLGEVSETKRSRVNIARTADAMTALDATSAKLTSDQERLFRKIEAEHARIHRPHPANTAVTLTSDRPAAPEPRREVVKPVSRATTFTPATLRSAGEIDAYLDRARERMVAALSDADAIRMN